jgi:hypothetical protein
MNFRPAMATQQNLVSQKKKKKIFNSFNLLTDSALISSQESINDKSLQPRQHNKTLVQIKSLYYFNLAFIFKMKRKSNDK